jgi:ADP-ribose pyrophosphatase YjhB (NUDIX family)
MREYKNLTIFTSGEEQKLNIVAGALIVKEDSILLVSTDDNPGQWKTPGGIIYDDSSIIENIKREVLEEVGLKIELRQELPPLLCLLQKEDRVYLLIYYLANQLSSFELSPENGLQTNWVKISQLEKLPGSTFAVSKIRGYLNDNLSYLA